MKAKKKSLTLLCLFAFFYSAASAASAAQTKQLPEDGRTYRGGVDLGFDQYKTTSLNGTKKVVLTFDDGPHPTRTPKTLDLLKRYNVKGTFFVLTEKFNSANEEILKRIIDEGHILASHGVHHKDPNGLSEGEFYYNLKESTVAITDFLKKIGSDQEGLYYRFPYGAYGKTSAYHHFNTMRTVSEDVYGDNCIHFSFWDIDSADWAPKLTVEEIADNMMAHIIGGTAYTVKTRRTIFGNTKYKVEDYLIRTPRGGGVILLHDIHERSIQATERFLQKAQHSGVEVIPMSDVEEFSFKAQNCRFN